MHYLIQSNMYSEPSYNQLLDALIRLGLSFSVHRVIPFVGYLDPPFEPTPGQKVCVLGTTTLARMAHERGWYPGSFLNAAFDYEVQMRAWGAEMVNADGHCYDLAAIPPQPQPFFVRPTLDSKDFTGHVTDWPTFEAWRTSVLALRPEDGSTVTPTTRVLVAPPKTLYAEYRTWIVDGKYVTGSLYRSGSWKRYDPLVPEEVVAYAERMAEKWAPALAWCLDVFDTPDGLRIGEVNNLNSAGWYAANVGKLLEALERAFG